jgi:hypothetical protein
MKINLIKEGNTLYPYSEEDEERLSKLSNAVYSVDLKNMDLRTIKQNRALHLWCRQIADLLNSKGLYLTGVFGNKIEWSLSLVKEQIVKATIKKVFGIDSTTKLTRKEIDDLIDFITEAFGTKGVVIPPFPNKELWEKENDVEK